MTHILSLSAKAQQFYENTRSRGMVSGYERNVLVREDYENCLFVDSKYIPQPGDTIFRCRTMNQSTIIELAQSIPTLPDLEIIAMKGKFTEQEWKTILDSMNGLMHSPEIDPRDEIAGEVENPELEKKIQALGKTEGYALLKAVQAFWNGRYQLNEFIARYL